MILGTHHDPEARARMSAARRKALADPEVRARMKQEAGEAARVPFPGLFPDRAAARWEHPYRAQARAEVPARMKTAVVAAAARKLPPAAQPRPVSRSFRKTPHPVPSARRNVDIRLPPAAGARVAARPSVSD